MDSLPTSGAPLAVAAALFGIIAGNVVLCQKRRSEDTSTQPKSTVLDPTSNKSSVKDKSAANKKESSKEKKFPTSQQPSEKNPTKEPDSKKPASKSSDEAKKTTEKKSKEEVKAPETQHATQRTQSTVPTEQPGTLPVGSSTTKPLPSAKMGAMPDDGRPRIEKTTVLSLKLDNHDTGLAVGSEKSNKTFSRKTKHGHSPDKVYEDITQDVTKSMDKDGGDKHH
ncbi:hypothetical protein L596_012254 [Steinernema carpocapsae]|uniref:Uncharacterized protein n=1 Tax=Steinernema carpocapsae TaxID=34508 RepID=A0A4U5NWK4_STECR|nr:hypothetical protein L596_012254 [Steinernema carpocapsae]